MSLTSALYTGVSGLSANGDAMNVIGNNISNVNTVGFKTARTLFSDLLSETRGAHAQVGRGVQMQAVENLFAQGSSQVTENVTDLSIQGNGFFAVNDGSTTYLTRAGAFHLDSSGNLVNADGLNVLGPGGGAITLGADAKITKIGTDGVISYLDSSNTAKTVTVGVANVTDTTDLQKVGRSLFLPSSAVTVKSVTAKQQILSNSLEQSNVDMASEFVRMIVTQRAYSANSKTITTTDQMTQEVLNMIR